MKRFFPSILLCSLTMIAAAATLLAADPVQSSAPANPTAYTALRAVAKSLGDKSLERVVEITGREGVPQPFLWRVTLKEPEGVREVEVAGGKISGQHVVSGKSAPGSGSLRLSDLNLDSSGAFDAADAQARKVRVRFDSVNYTLHVNEGGKPVWTLELFNQDGGSIGKMRLAANNGTTTSVDGRLAALPAASSATVTGTTNVNPPPPERRAPPPPLPTPAQPPTTTVVTTNPSGSTTTTTTVTNEVPGRVVIDGEDEDDSGFFTRTGRTLDHTTNTVKRTVGNTNDTVVRTIRRTGTKIQRFFVGHGDHEDEETQEAPR